MTRAPREFFQTDAATLAKTLIGQRLVRVLDDGTRLSGLIVETEAYLGVRDRAAHAFGGRRTDRNESMYQRAGTLYVYFTYGMHHCMNVVCGEVGEPTAVLLRALEPTEGIDRMRAHRSARTVRELRETDLCSGPAKLCQALSIDRSQDGIDLVGSGEILVERTRSRAMADKKLVNTSRVGVDYAGAWARRRLRWYLRGSAHASRP